jgi:hypothetical protein
VRKTSQKNAKRTTTELGDRRLENKLAEYEVALNDEDSEELVEFLKHVPEDQVQKVIGEVAGKDDSVGDTIRAAWDNDQKRNSE